MFDTLSQEARAYAAVTARREEKSRRRVGWWLVGVAGLILIMVMVGGATRLTESGLSMVDWRPVTGFVPPMTESAWTAEFEKYRTSPEYQLVNKGMSLDDFKTIYHWEFWHRNLGRFIGLAFLLPLVYFAWTRQLSKAIAPRLVLLFILGSGQGALGWYMVQSGLVDEPAVSHYRLAAHLGLALILFSAVFWTALDLLTSKPDESGGIGAAAIVWLFGIVLALQIVYGAFVAGLDAGYVFNTWPMLDGAWLPDGLFWGETPLQAATGSALTVQFVHRMLAYGLFIFAGFVAWQVPRLVADKAASNLAGLLFFAIVGQVLLGIFTLLAQVPVSLGTAHQGWAVFVLGLTLALAHRLKQRRAWA